MTSDSQPPEKPKRRWLPRYSLRSLLLFVILVNSIALLWAHWAPWVLETTLKGHTAQVNSAAFSPDGKRVVTGSHDHTAIVWDVITGERLMALETEAYVDHVGFLRDGKRIFTASNYFSIPRISSAWDAENGKLLERSHPIPCTTLGWLISTQDGIRFATYDRSGLVTIKQFTPNPEHVLDGKVLYAWRAHEAAVLSLEFSHDDMRLVTTGKDRLAKIWRYRHPEWWWGVFYLLEFWATALLSIALAWSLLRDRRMLRQ